MGLQPTMGMKIGLRKVWSAITPNFVISTGAKRSGEICGFSRRGCSTAVAFLSVIPEGNLLFVCPKKPEADSLREWQTRKAKANTKALAAEWRDLRFQQSTRPH